MQRPVRTQRGLSCEGCENLIYPYEKYAKCSCRGIKPYVLCQRCFQSLIEKKGTILARCPHSTRGDNGLVVVMPKDNYVHIFLDNSNFWIEGKKLATRNLNLMSNEDPRLRLDIDKLTSKVARGREVASKSLYGSRHADARPNSLWRKFGERGWNCKVTKRKRNEKGVDQHLVADLTKLVSEAYVEVGTAVVLCGDGDVIPAVSICLEKKWNCEVVMWQDAVSDSLHALAKEFPQFLRIVYADPFIEEICYTDYRFDIRKLKEMPHLKSQAAVLLNIDFPFDKRWVRKMTTDLRWPFECSLNGNDLILVLVSCQNREVDKGNAKEYFDEFLLILRRKYGDKAQSYVEYDQHRRSTVKKEIPIPCTNRFVVLEELRRRLKELKQSGDLSSLRDKQASPVFDSSMRSSICSTATSSLTSGFQSRGSPFSLSRSTSRASLASSGYGGILNDQVNENLLKEAGGRFQTVVPRRSSKTAKLCQKPWCRNKGSCTYGLRCRFRHTEEEKKFFENPKKDTRCWRNKCNGLKCSYAHSLEDGFCRRCNKWGHLQSENCRHREC